MRLRKAFLVVSPFLMAVLIANFLVFSISGAAAAFKNLKVGDQALPIELKDLDGKTHSLSDYKASKAILILFWASWSERSVKELEELGRIQKEYGEKGLTILAINVEKQELKSEDLAKVKDVVSQKAPPFPVLLDEGLKVYNAYGTMVNPTTAIVDANGTVVFDLSGFATSGGAEVEAAVRKALGVASVEETALPKKQGYQPVPAAMRHAGMGKRLVDEGLSEKGLTELNKAMGLDSLYPDPRIFAGLAYVKSGKRDLAEQFLKRAQELDPAAPGPPLLLSLIAAEKSLVKEALTIIEMAVEAEKKAVADTVAAGFREEAPPLGDLDLAAVRALAGEGKEAEAQADLVKALTARLVKLSLNPAPAKKQLTAAEKFQQRVDLKSEGKLGGVAMEPQEGQTPAPSDGEGAGSKP